MTPAEEIDHLKRQIADLTDRVRLLEACQRDRPAIVHHHHHQAPAFSPGPVIIPHPLPQRDPLPPWTITCGVADPAPHGAKQGPAPGTFHTMEIR